MIRRASNVCKSFAADAICREALGICRRIALGQAPHIAKLLRVEGVIRHRKGDLAEAETLLREALAGQRRLLGNDHPLVAECLGSLAEVVLDAARFTEAETHRPRMPRHPPARAASYPSADRHRRCTREPQPVGRRSVMLRLYAAPR